VNVHVDPEQTAASTLVVAVCALTFRRPHGLRSLLDGLRALDDPGAGYEVRVVIVDNDDAATGKAVIDDAADLPWPITYEVEERRGIAQGRNRAVRIAREAGADVVVFLDDDEVPDPRWLVELLSVYRSTGADVVTGPVLPEFGEPPPAWVEAGRFFERPRYATGTRIHYARTSNVLIASHVVPDGDAPFAEWFGLSGGDDTHFFLRARLAGHRIVWADEAVVREVVPPSRVEVRWLVKREYRRGNTLSLCLRDLMYTRVRVARRAAQGLLRIVEGALVLASAVMRGRAVAVQGLQLMGFGAGLLSGLAGVRYDEYAVVHGS
jgi:succinoglycan biosynthesis protein ExoM